MATTEATEAELAARAAGWVLCKDPMSVYYRRPNGELVNNKGEIVGPLLADLAAKGWDVEVEVGPNEARVRAASPLPDSCYGEGTCSEVIAAALVAAVAAAVRAKGGVG